MIQKFLDSIYNIAVSTISNTNGIGTASDPGKSFNISRVKPVNDYEIAALYLSSGILQKVVDLIPSLSQNVEINVTSQSQAEVVQQIKQDLINRKFLKLFVDASVSARLFRESYILLDVDDNTSYDQPINWDTCKGLKDCYFLEYGAVTPIWSVNSLLRTGYRIQTTNTRDPNMPFESANIINADRVLLFTGKKLTPKMEHINNGRHSSLLDGLVEQYGTMQNAYNNSASIVNRVLTFVYKMKGLLTQLELGNEQSILKRLRLAKQNIGALGGILTDLETEEIEPMQVSLAGIPEVIRSHKELFTAQTELTHDQLWNEGSIDTKSELEDKNFQRVVLNFIRNNWLDHWQKMCKIYAYAYTQDVEDLTFTLNLPEPETSVKEDLEAKYLQAQIDQIYINLEVLTREIVQGNRFNDQPFNTDLTQQSNEGLNELDQRKQEAVETQMQARQPQDRIQDSKKSATFSDAAYSSPTSYQFNVEDIQRIVSVVAETNPLVFAFLNAERYNDTTENDETEISS